VGPSPASRNPCEGSTHLQFDGVLERGHDTPPLTGGLVRPSFRVVVAALHDGHEGFGQILTARTNGTGEASNFPFQKYYGSVKAFGR
jgi:hypothetical protein